MPHYKDTENKVQFLDDAAFEYLLPDGCIQITPEEASELLKALVLPTAIPRVITNYQGKVTLDYYRIYDEVEAYMLLPDTPRAAKLAWATGAFERQGTMVLAMAAMLGLTDEQVDAMFIYGSEVE